MAELPKVDLESKDLVAERIEQMKTLFPEIVTEGDGTIDFDKLRLILGNDIADGDERYAFTWPGKNDAIRLSQTTSKATLRPLPEQSVNWDETGNLYIEGDNLEVLKLLQRAYFGKVKLIYIDPPYNTGHDFVYSDSFEDTLANYIEQSEQANQSNPETSGRYHSDWCSMMYPRLRLARELLADDGAIFISIDDNEVNNLTRIMDEIFGEHNRIALICHKARASVSNDKIISPNHNTVLFYAKQVECLEAIRKSIGLDPVLDGFEQDDGDGRGAYRLVPVDGPGGAKKGNPYYEFLGVAGYWRFSKETMQQKYDDGLVVKRGNSLYQKYFLSTAMQTRRTATTWWDDAGLTSNATSRLKALMDGAAFDTPKPIELVYRMIQMICFSDKEAIVLDFFSGSATTAQAVMEFNAQYTGDRHFILVQLPEVTPDKSDARAMGYENLCQVGEERIRRAGAALKTTIDEENKQLKLGEQPKEVPDIGFRVFRLDESNFDEPKNGQLLIDRIKPDRTELDIIFEMMLKWGLELTYPIEEIEIKGYPCYSIAGDELICCMKPGLTVDVLEAIASLEPAPSRVFLLDSVIDDTIKLNALQIFKRVEERTQQKIDLRTV